ncbi:uncharacterized protein LOC122294694 [Carya illinoinensis]|uniref:uncharacterized protein LOC122294694 n=1 Tax=Carya illinoinensis TaxID=32201 RepID=UPI001C7199BE|nr:uncharacterized protein LOC122294694 [Carya illinoinensis]
MEAKDLAKRWERLQLITEESSPFQVKLDGPKERDKMEEYCIVGSLCFEQQREDQVPHQFGHWLRAQPMHTDIFNVYKYGGSKGVVNGGASGGVHGSNSNREEQVSGKGQGDRGEPMPSNHAVQQEVSAKMKEIFLAENLEKAVQVAKGQKAGEEAPTTGMMTGTTFETGTKSQLDSHLPSLYEAPILDTVNGTLLRRNTTIMDVDQDKGDFNEILHQKEKQGAASRPYKQIENFKKVNQRKKINTIRSVEDSQGRVVDEQEGVGEVFTGFFTYLFTTSSPSNFEECLVSLNTTLITEMTDWLLAPFTREEIYGAVIQMNPLGSPGPDGFPAFFYQKHCEIIGKEVCQFALHVLNQDGSLAKVNDTLIYLIPKVKCLKRVTEYRPISLCNVLYKIVSKTLANRLKTILSKLISPNQSAFVPGRLISDNVLVAYEALHSMGTRMKGRKWSVALKLDMSKAYDRVEWGFVEVVMSKMGFPLKWINLIQTCLNSITYSILVNGAPQQKFVPSRGIRQGDPMSPYIFIICAEALTSLLNQAEKHKEITPIHIGRGPITINHLFFADDNLLFCQANPKELMYLLDTLAVYEQASGQMLNKEKSSVFFSKNSKKETKEQILQLAGVKTNDSFEKYLGLLACVGRTKVVAFHSFIDKTWAKIANWKTKHLSIAGKEVLLKSVIQAIPAYTMGIFLLPNSITRKLNQLLRKFWWGYNEDTSKIQWVNWNQINNNKEAGGLGFRDFRSFNIALLSKQGWRMINNPTSLEAMIIKQKYCGTGEFLEAQLGSRPSFAWRGIHAGLEVLKKGMVWRVGNGQRVYIWLDSWIPSLPLYKVTTPREEDCWCEQVSGLIDPICRRWKDYLLQEIFSTHKIDAIKAIPICLGDREDRMIWQHTNNGQFSVKSCYHMHRSLEADLEGESSSKRRDIQVWKTIWKLKTTPAIKIFISRACSEVFPTLANLKRRRVVEDSSCIICKQFLETPSHALWGCLAAQDVWNQSSKKIQKMTCHSDHFFDIWSNLVEVLSTNELGIVAGISKGIWNRRNEIMHGKGRVISQTEAHKWKKPAENPYKINWDAAVRSIEGRIGIGVIIRDHTGQVAGALRAQRSFRERPFDAEAYGLLIAVVFIKEIGIKQVCLEGDSKQVVDLTVKQGLDWSMGGCLVEDARKILNSFARWSISHVPH